MIVTYFEHTKDTDTNADTKLVELDISKPLPRTVPKKDLPLWSLTRFNGPRSIENAVDVYGVTFDVDIEPVPSLQAVRAAVAGAGIAGFVYCSPSATTAKPRWRLAIDTDEPIPAKDYKRIATYVSRALPFPVASNSLEPARMWYMSREPEEGPFIYERFDGDPLDVRRLLLEAPHIRSNNAEEVSTLPEKTGKDLDDAILRMRKYLSSVQPCTEDGESSKKLMRYAATLRASCLPFGTCLELFKEFDQRCIPPWGEYELVRALNSAGQGPVVAEVAKNIEAADRLFKNLGQTSPKGEAATSAAIDIIGTENGPSVTDPLRGLVHLSKLAIVGRDKIVALSEKPIVWLWDNIASAGLTILMAAQPSSGKTTLLFLLIAARLNTGEPISVLGHEVTPAPDGKWIVVIEAEHSDESASRVLRKSFKQQGLDEEALDRVILVARGGVRLGDSAWQDVVTLIRAGLVSDVVLDTLARVSPGGDSNKEEDQVNVFDTIAKTIESAPTPEDRPTFWVATHLRKVDGQVPTLNDVSGSTQRAGQADVVLLMGASREGSKVKSVTCAFGKVRERDPEDWPDPVEYVVKRDGIELIALPEKDERPLTEQIATRLELGLPLTKHALRTKLNRSAQDVENALTELFKARRVEKTSIRSRGKEIPAYMLRPDGTAERREIATRTIDGLTRLKEKVERDRAAATSESR